MITPQQATKRAAQQDPDKVEELRAAVEEHVNRLYNGRDPIRVRVNDYTYLVALRVRDECREAGWVCDWSHEPMTGYEWLTLSVPTHAPDAAKEAV